MVIEVLTKEDLNVFETRLLSAMESVIKKYFSFANEKPEGYKTSGVRKILGCSVNKLVSLRISRNLGTKKIGSTLYYNKSDIRHLLDKGYQEATGESQNLSRIEEKLSAHRCLLNIVLYRRFGKGFFFEYMKSNRR